MTEEEKTYYYIAIHNAARTTLLAGPYEDEAAAIGVKHKAWAKACELDEWCWFHTASLARSPEKLPTLFGTNVE